MAFHALGTGGGRVRFLAPRPEPTLRICGVQAPRSEPDFGESVESIATEFAREMSNRIYVPFEEVLREHRHGPNGNFRDVRSSSKIACPFRIEDFHMPRRHHRAIALARVNRSVLQVNCSVLQVNDSVLQVNCGVLQKSACVLNQRHLCPYKRIAYKASRCQRKPPTLVGGFRRRQCRRPVGFVPDQFVNQKI